MKSPPRFTAARFATLATKPQAWTLYTAALMGCLGAWELDTRLLKGQRIRYLQYTLGPLYTAKHLYP